MKQLTSLLIAGAFSVSAYAQNGFYGAASAGIGTGIVKSGITYYDKQGAAISQSAIISHNAMLTLGYQYKNWRVQTGLQYLKSGYELSNLRFGTDFDPNLSAEPFEGDYTITHNHIGIPLQIGYVIAPAKRISLVPYLGILTTYNTGASSVIRTSGNEATTQWTKSDFENRYKRTSVWGTAALHLEYKLTQKVSLFAGPSLQYMLTGFDKATSKQRSFNLNLNLGVKVRL